MKEKRFYWPVKPIYKGNSVISGLKYRFTALTSRLIRLEFSEDGIFEDRASQVVFNRDFKDCYVQTNIDNGILVFETEDLILKYKENQIFANDTLSIKLKKEPASVWRFGD
jgi:hypothetical protein